MVRWITTQTEVPGLEGVSVHPIDTLQLILHNLNVCFNTIVEMILVSILASPKMSKCPNILSDTL
jgi:hypothetical protein